MIRAAQPADSETKLCESTTACDFYVAMSALLGCNLIFCGFRLLYMFSVNQQIGVLIIIASDIVATDIKPWLVLWCASYRAGVWL